MKCTIPEISWHNRDPVLSVDIQVGKHKSSNETFWRIASGGNDSHVLIWHLVVNQAGVASVNCVGDLERHQKAVNIVRFSPSGEFLASGDDDAMIIIWKRREDFDGPLFPEENLNNEQWQSLKVLRGHVEDVSDLCWSPDSNSLISGSVDNSVILWDVPKGRKTIISDYKGFVQGVAWDPCNQFACTISSDRHCRLIDLNLKKTIQRVNKSKIPTPAGHPLQGKLVRLFHDDTFRSFYRRLTYTPDGSLIIVPSGIIESSSADETFSNATIVFARHNIREPVMVLPSLKENTIAVRCCPKYFKLRKNGPPSFVPVPYRMIFAVATNKSILLYDTQQMTPIAMISNIHYTRLTDVSWSSDAEILVVSSTDGYCSLVHFEVGELGEFYEPATPLVTTKKPTIDKSLNNVKGTFIEPDSDAMDIDITKCVSPKLELAKKLEPVVEVQSKKVQSEDDELKEETCDIKLVLEDSNSKTSKEESSEKDDSESSKNSGKVTPIKTQPPILLNKTPRRVELITISSPKQKKKQT